MNMSKEDLIKMIGYSQDRTETYRRKIRMLKDSIETELKRQEAYINQLKELDVNE